MQRWRWETYRLKEFVRSILMPQARELVLYVGTYTQALPHVNGRGAGIYRYRLDAETGALAADGVAAHLANPTFLAPDPARRRLYAASEVNEVAGLPGAAVHAFAIDDEAGTLTHLNWQSTGDAAACHVAVDGSGRCVLAANYAGSVTVLPVGHDGRLGPLTQRVQHTGPSSDPAHPTWPHPHGVHPDPTGRYLLVPDLGLDRIFIYRLAPEQVISAPHDPPWSAAHAGAGPRHLAFHPNGRWIYCANELDATVSAFAFDIASGGLTEIGWVSMLPAGFAGASSGAEIAVDRAGRFAYASSRGHDSIASFAIDPEGGALTPTGHVSTRGRTPRHFALSPDGRLLVVANQDSDSVVTFHVDPDTGRPTPTGHVAEVPSPVCVVMLEVGGWRLKVGDQRLEAGGWPSA
jgi:6-phosphogluconolactonase